MSPATNHLGIDVGGTKSLGVVVDADARIVRTARHATPHGADAVIDTIVALVDELGPVDTVGVGVAGLVTHDGVLRAAPNLPGIRELAVGDRLRRRLGRDVAVENDATCATVAEWRLGAGDGVPEMLMVALGTGIGGGVVSGGEIRRGRNGFAGEFGHMVIDPHGPPCVCGRRGCWERFASGAGMARLAREAALGGRAARVVDLAGGDAELVRGEHVQTAAREGDADALAVVDEFGRWVALGLANLTNAFDPEVIVVGGGLVSGVDLYREPVERWFAELLYAPEARPHPRLTVARLGEQAGAVGAALLGAGRAD